MFEMFENSLVLLIFLVKKLFIISKPADVTKTKRTFLSIAIAFSVFLLFYHDVPFEDLVVYYFLQIAIGIIKYMSARHCP